MTLECPAVVRTHDVDGAADLRGVGLAGDEDLPPGLDQHASEMLSEWLKRLRSSDRTTLMVTHDLERGIDMADTVAVLVNGQLIYEEPRDSIDIHTFRQTYYALVGRGHAGVG